MKLDSIHPGSSAALSSPLAAATLPPLDPAEFIAPPWYGDLKENGLVSFDRFWRLRGEEVDVPNFARGGWSCVSRFELSCPRKTVMYVKRQLRYQSRTWRHPLRGVPTLQREFQNLEHCRRHGIPTASVIYFATATLGRWPAAILVTEGLVDFETLDVHFKSLSACDKTMRDSLLMSVARALGRLHRSGLKHGCLYPKHILVPARRAKPEQVRFIDLEKARPILFRRTAMRRDFGTLFRRMPMWTAPDRALFLEAYQSVF